MAELMNPWGLYLLAVFIPVIILYFLRPKPKDLHIPSLMFIMEIEHRRRFRSLFRRMLRDPLLIIQLVALGLVVAAVADPFYVSAESKSVSQDVVIVLDVSASMGAQGRLSQAKQAAASAVSDLGPADKVSIVLAENVPMVLLRQGEKNRALSLVENVGQKATPSGLGGAMLLGIDIIKGSSVQKRMYVISDFSSHVGMDPLAAQKAAFAEEISVKLIKVGGGGENAGIISARSGRTAGGCFAEAVVKNYGPERIIEASFKLGGRDAGATGKNIPANGSEAFYFSADCATSRLDGAVTIAPGGDLAADDSAYFVIPEASRASVLLIRERDSDEHLKYALESLGWVTLSESYPPIYPQDYSAYDVVIFQEAKAQNILKGTFLKLKDYVGGGGRLVVLGFQGLTDMDTSELEGLLPVEPIEVVRAGGRVTVKYRHEILADVDTGDISISKYVSADESQGALTILEAGGVPLVSVWEVGKGKAGYVGIMTNSSWSDFYLKPSFPIFWHNVVYWMNRDESAGNTVNFKTGEELPAPPDKEMRVTKPSGEIVSGKDVVLDEAGFYQVEGGQRAAASLLDEGESDIAYAISGESAEFDGGYSAISVEEEVQHELFWACAAAALALIIMEWFYYKRRGSLA
jgi:hypothetical protein